MTKLIRTNAFQGRTAEGIAFEIICHYAWFKMGLIKKHTQSCDMGSTVRGSKDFDENAVVFERNRSKFSNIEEYVANGSFAKVFSKTSGIFVQVCAIGAWSKVD